MKVVVDVPDKLITALIVVLRYLKGTAEQADHTVLRQTPRLKPWIKCETVLLNLGDWEGTETVTSYELRIRKCFCLETGQRLGNKT